MAKKVSLAAQINKALVNSPEFTKLRVYQQSLENRVTQLDTSASGWLGNLEQRIKLLEDAAVGPIPTNKLSDGAGDGVPDHVANRMPPRLAEAFKEAFEDETDFQFDEVKHQLESAHENLRDILNRSNLIKTDPTLYWAIWYWVDFMGRK